MPTLQQYEGKVYLWKYIPSLPASIIFASLFFVATAAHAWKMYRTKMWFCIPFVLGGVFEVVGYINRAAAYNDTGSLTPYLLQSLFLLIAPVVFAASLYMVYSRLVRAVHGECFSLVRPAWTTRIFVLLDLAFLSVQSNGAGLLAKTKTAQLGEDIVVAGLILQVLGFLGFVACCGVFHKRFRASERGASATPGAATSLPWQGCLNMLYVTSVAILVRNLFRVVEFIMGTDGYLQAHEWTVYTFDGALMLLVMGFFYVWHPSLLQPGPNAGTRESMIELTGDEGDFRPSQGRREETGPNASSHGEPKKLGSVLKKWTIIGLLDRV